MSDTDALKIRRLLIVEDEPAIRECLVDFFEGKGFHTVTAATVAAAAAAIHESTFTAILLDLLLGDGDGLDFLVRLRKKDKRTPVLILTARGEETLRVRGLNAGADDYVVKPFGVYEVLARIEAILRRSGEVRSEVMIGDAIVDFERLTIRKNGTELRLLQKEAELLAFFAKRPGLTFRREELLREVWGYDAAPTTRTVDTHVFQLRRKLETDAENPRHLITVFGVGYRFDADPTA